MPQDDKADVQLDKGLAQFSSFGCDVIHEYETQIWSFCQYGSKRVLEAAAGHVFSSPSTVHCSIQRWAKSFRADLLACNFHWRPRRQWLYVLRRDSSRLSCGLTQAALETRRCVYGLIMSQNASARPTHRSSTAMPSIED